MNGYCISADTEHFQRRGKFLWTALFYKAFVDSIILDHTFTATLQGHKSTPLCLSASKRVVKKYLSSSAKLGKPGRKEMEEEEKLITKG